MDITEALTLTDDRTSARREPAQSSFEHRFADALRRRLYPRTRLRLKTLSRDTGYSEDTITRWTQAKHRVFAGAVEDLATYFAARFDDYGLLHEVFGRVAGWAHGSPTLTGQRWPVETGLAPGADDRVLATNGSTPA
jgi:hypothetical protein